MKGILVNNDVKHMNFINNICDIDTNNYDKIYRLDDNWVGSLLFIKGNKYRFIQCGSGVPIIMSTERIGVLIN